MQRVRTLFSRGFLVAAAYGQRPAQFMAAGQPEAAASLLAAGAAMPAARLSEALGLVLAKLSMHLLEQAGMSLGGVALAMPAGSDTMLMP